jgi:hypothetical protein
MTSSTWSLHGQRVTSKRYGDLARGDMFIGPTGHKCKVLAVRHSGVGPTTRLIVRDTVTKKRIVINLK